MRSFTSIAAEQNSSLAVVAPGIAEALFATAIGLFAAIPAVIAYNRFSHGINRLEARLNRFADGFYSTLSRELETNRYRRWAIFRPAVTGVAAHPGRKSMLRLWSPSCWGSFSSSCC